MDLRIRIDGELFDLLKDRLLQFHKKSPSWKEGELGFWIFGDHWGELSMTIPREGNHCTPENVVHAVPLFNKLLDENHLTQHLKDQQVFLG